MAERKSIKDQCYLSEELIEQQKLEVGGGHGILHGRLSYTREEAAEGWSIREIGFMRLEPGDSIGVHTHTDNEDAYIILKGKGLFTDGTEESEVHEGDITIARRGDTHSLANIGDEPLLFLDVIAK